MNQWRPNPGSQECALRSNAFELFFGGSVGGGKSQFLLVDALGQISNPSYRAALFRKTFPELEKSLIFDSRALYPSQGGVYNEQKHRWTFPSGATIDFGHLDTMQDVFSYQSAQYAYLGFDEATHFSEFQIEYMKSRCRCADPRVKKYIRYASNPGNRGHEYFKKRFIDGKEPYKIYKNDKTGLSMQFIPSKVYDNKVLMKGDPDYVKRLEGLPEQERKMLLDGSWDVFAGQYFSEWDMEIHVVAPFEVPEGWKRIRGIDHGRTAPTACMWGAVDHDGRIYWYREYYMAGRDADLNAQEIARLSQGERYSFTTLDSACFSQTGTGETIAEIYHRNGVACDPSPKNRLAGWSLFHEYLRPDIATSFNLSDQVVSQEGLRAKMVFFSNCVNAIRSIPTLIHDIRHPEDLDCFVAGTQVTTIAGERNIEEIKVGDLVLTPIGYKPVIRDGISGFSKRNTRVELSNGKSLIGTSNHKVFVYDRGLVPLSSLKKDEILMGDTTSLCKTRQLITKGLFILDAYLEDTMIQMGHILPKDMLRFIVRFGLLTMVKSFQVIRSIIKTTMLITTTSLTSKWSNDVHMPKSTTKTEKNRSWQKLLFGEKRHEVSKSFQKMLEKCWLIRSRRDLRAEIVDCLLRHRANKPSIVDRVECGLEDLLKRNALYAKSSFGIKETEKKQHKPVRIVAVGNYVGEIVYNLTVADARLYFANGVLVTNTSLDDHVADCVRYILETLHEGKSPVPLDPLEKKLQAWKKHSTLTPTNLNRFYANR